ncbi:hypothetical protein ACOME3_007396 [Neoechinorhynchus agilis]
MASPRRPSLLRMNAKVDLIVSASVRSIYDYLFDLCDTDRRGVILSLEASLLFRRSQLPNQTLADIWNEADESSRGLLCRLEFYIALKLISVCQQQNLVNVSRDMVYEGCGPPRLGIYTTADPVNGVSIASLLKYESEFYEITKDQTTRGVRPIVTGTQARKQFLRFNLPAEELATIWDSSDSDNDGCLDRKEYCVARHFIDHWNQDSLDPTDIHNMFAYHDQKHREENRQSFGEFFDVLSEIEKSQVVSGITCRSIFTQYTELNADVLFKIWEASDWRGVGNLDYETRNVNKSEFIYCLNLIALSITPPAPTSPRQIVRRRQSDVENLADQLQKLELKSTDFDSILKQKQFTLRQRQTRLAEAEAQLESEQRILKQKEQYRSSTQVHLERTRNRLEQEKDKLRIVDAESQHGRLLRLNTLINEVIETVDSGSLEGIHEKLKSIVELKKAIR